MDIVPVRRDGTGRLVAVGLIEVMDVDGVQRWTTIGAAEAPGESVDNVVERCLGDTLGPGAHGQRSNPRTVGLGRRGDRSERSWAEGLRAVAGPCAVEIWGRIEPRGVALRFSWFLVTALPAQHAIVADKQPVLADFLEMQGEPGLAGRLRGF
jgi:hypothetical protein